MERFRPRNAWLFLLTGLIGLAGAACSSGSEGEDPSAQARILTFEADPLTIREGESTQLSWNTSNARSVRIDAGGVLLDLGELPKEGAVEVTPKASTTYRLEVVGENGKPVSASVAIDVQPLGPPTIERFEASAAVVGRGTPVTLSWSVIHADGVEVRESSGRTLSKDAAGEGTLEVTPSRTTSYLLVATNERGVSSEELTVAIGTPPTITLQADAEDLKHGADLTLSWVVEDAMSVVVRDPAGGVLHEGPGESGSTTFSAVLSGAYTATAVGAGDVTATSSTFVAVSPVIESFTAVVQGSVRPGALAFVAWTVHGADSVEIQNASGLTQTFAGAAGDASLPVGTGGGFTLRAYSGPTVSEAAASVQVVETPLIRSLTTGPLVTAGQGQSGTSSVAWEIDGAATIRMEVDPGGIVDLTDKSPRIDEVDVVFLAAGKITVTASNPSGQTVRVIDAPVDPVPTIRSFFAAPSRAGSGDPVEIHWETLHAQSVVLEMDGQERAVDPTNVNGYFTTPILAAPSSYVLRATNGLGFEVMSEPIVVDVGAPAITSFRTKTGRSLYPAGSEVEFLWENDGGSSLTLTDELGAVACSSSEWTAIREGGCSVTLPSTQKFKTFTLAVTNSSGTDSYALDIGAVTGPIITSFTADRPAMTEGEYISFSWIAEPDADGNEPTLTLVDQNGTVYQVDDANSLGDTKRFQIPTWGDYTFTLTATTVIDPPFPFDLPLTVYGVPVIGDLASNPPFAEDEGDAITFSWTSTHGASAEILALDRDGKTGATLFTTNSKATVDAGSASLQPTIAAPNVRLVVRNPLGAPNHKDFRIGVNPASIISFTANGVQAPAVVDVLRGQTVELAWQTARATNVGMDVGWGTSPFVDLRQSATATDVGLQGAGDTGSAQVAFPSGFTFPYDGQNATVATVTVDGWMSFLANQTTSCCASSLPSTTYSRIHVLPFWDDLQTNRSTPGGTILWEYFAAPVPHLVIQWADMNFWSSPSRQPSDLNFQVALYQTGEIEFRWDQMSCILPEHAEGSTAVIGLHNRAGNKMRFVSDRTRVQGGLIGKSYYFFPDSLPMSDTRTIFPTSSMTYSMRAWNGHSDHEQEFEIRVHDPGHLSVWSDPAEPLPGDPVALHWEGSNLTSLTIEDDSGNVVYTASPGDLEGGSLDLGSLAQGIHAYTFRAVGMVSIDQLTETLVVSANDPFSLDSFTATDATIKVTDPPVILSWESTGAVSGTITELPSGVVYNIPAGDLASGSHPVTPQRTSTYVLDLESHQRYRQAEILVEVRTVWIDDFAASALSVPAGGSVTLNWDTTADGTVGLRPLDASTLALVETSTPFEDVSGLGQSPIISTGQDSDVTLVSFPNGFEFPFFGGSHDGFVVSADGWVSFDQASTSSWSSNQQIPTTSTSYSRISLPVFWDDLHTGTNGRVDGVLLSNPTRYVVQWTNLQRYFPSGNRNWDLNFQVVLYPNGSFEYRYGAMDAPPGGATSTSDCNPTHCENEAMGSSASVGFQKLDGTAGYQLHYGAGGASAPVFTGGFGGRSFFYDASVPNGVASKTVSPSEPTTYTLCIEDADWQECREVHVNVVYPGDLVISELMVSPANGVAGQWFEVRNISRGDLDLEGLTIEMGAASHTIQTGGPLVLPKGGHLVFARTDDPSLAPDYVYGPTMELMAPAGDVSIHWDGVKMAEATWTSSWTITPGVSLGLDPAKVRLGVVTRSTFGDFCAATDSYDGGTSLGTPGGMSDCGTHGYLFDPFSNRPFIDITDVGTRSTILQADTAVSTLSNGLPFNFPFFNTVQTEVWQNSNGLIGFGNSNATNTSGNRDLHGTGTTANTGIIAGYWDDLTVSDDGTSFVALHFVTVDGLQAYIVQYNGLKRWNQTGAITFQIQIWENGDIVIAFGDLVGNNYYFGGDATIGIEAPGGSPELQYLYNQAILRPHQSLYFQKL